MTKEALPLSIVRCKRCHEVMFEAVPLDDQGHFAIDEESSVDAKTDERGSCIPCPHCGAQHLLVDTTSPSGPPEWTLGNLR